MPINQSQSGFMLYFDMLNCFDDLTDAQTGRLIKDAIKYAEMDITPHYEEAILKMAWKFMKSAIDKDSERYEKKCKENKLRAKYGAYKNKRENAGNDVMSFEEWKEREETNAN